VRKGQAMRLVMVAAVVGGVAVGGFCGSTIAAEVGKDVRSTAERLSAGQVMILSPTTGGFERKWVGLEELGDDEVLRAQDRIELAYGQPWKQQASWRAGRRADDATALRHKLGSNKDPAKAVQVRIYCICATRVAAKWKDKEGREHQYRWETPDPDPFLDAVRKQMRISRT